MEIVADVWKQFEDEIKNKIREKLNEEQSSKNQDLQKDLIKVRSKLKILADSLNTMIFDIHSILDEYDLGEEKEEPKLKLYDPVNNSNPNEKNKYRQDLLNGLSEILSQEEMKDVIKLSNNHTLRIYELLTRYKDGFTVGFDQMKRILSLGKDSYRSFPIFRTNILEQAQREISRNTSIKFEFKITYPEAGEEEEETIDFWTV